jgi:hypothetical protein
MGTFGIVWSQVCTWWPYQAQTWVMVAWKTLAECSRGQCQCFTCCEILLNPHSAVQLVAIANDITYNSGAFGPKEDAAFRAATEYALDRKLPVVYLAANSGARVGLANEIKACLKVRLLDPRLGEPALEFLLT